MNIVFSADNSYAQHLAVTIASILKSCLSGEVLSIYIIDDGISAENKAKLERHWPTSRLTVKWIKSDASKYPKLPISRGRITTYHRLYIGSLLPLDIKKVIWLDCDLIFLRDITDLWKHDVSNHHFFAAQDSVIPTLGSLCGIKGTDKLGLSRSLPYFNAGVLLINLDWWRRFDVKNKAIKYLQDNFENNYFWDQDALNAVLAKHCTLLDSRWNQIDYAYNRLFSRRRNLYKKRGKSSIETPWVMHYAGCWKPWLYQSKRESHQLYFKFLKDTAWKDWRPKSSFSLKTRALKFYEERILPISLPFEPFLANLIGNVVRLFRKQ